MTTTAPVSPASRVTLTRDESCLLHALCRSPIMVEFDLTESLASGIGISNVDAAPRVPGTLGSLRDKGLVWAGKLHNKANQSMWVAVATSDGKKVVSEGR
jgi:hypothetical protein